MSNSHHEPVRAALRGGAPPGTQSSPFSQRVHTASLCEEYFDLVDTMRPRNRAGGRGAWPILGMAEPHAAAASSGQYLVEDEWTCVTPFEKDDAVHLAQLPTSQKGVLRVCGSLTFLTPMGGTYAFDVDVELRMPRDLAFPVSKDHVWATDGGRTGSPVKPAAGGGQRWASR